MKKLFQLVMIICMGFFINSCYYDAFEEEEFIPMDDGTVVSYQTDVIPLWSQCVGCHKGDEPPDLRDNVSYDELLNGYVVPGDAESSILYQSLIQSNGISLMPPGAQWPDSKINTVKNWIDQEALNS